MDRRNDPLSPPGGRSPWGRATSAPGPWSRWNRPPQQATLATPLSWMGGSLLLTGTTFLVSIIALVRAIIALVD